MPPRQVKTFLRWLARRVSTNNLATEEVFFREALKWETGTVDEWQVGRCLQDYREKGIVPSFVIKAMKYLYPCFLVEEP